METVEDILECRLKDLYNAEFVVIKTLTKMIRYTTDIQIKRVFTDQLKESERNKKSLKELFSTLHISPHVGTCISLAGLLERINHVQRKDLTERFKNDEMIAAAKRMEQYKVNGYISAFANARKLGYNCISDTLQKTLDETYETDQKLKKIARIRNFE